MPLGPEGRLLDGTHVLGHFAPLGRACRGSLITMTCFSWLKGLETQRWPGLCDLFISLQGGLCGLIRGGWAEEAGEGSKHTYRKQTKQTRWAAHCFGAGAGAGGARLWGLPGGSGPGRRPGLPLRLLPVPPAAPPWSRLPEPPAWSALAIWPAPWERRWRVRGGQSGSRKERTGRAELLLESAPVPRSAPTPPPQTGVQGSLGPRDSTPLAEPASALQPQNRMGPGTWLQCVICM